MLHLAPTSPINTAIAYPHPSSLLPPYDIPSTNNATRSSTNVYLMVARKTIAARRSVDMPMIPLHSAYNQPIESARERTVSSPHIDRYLRCGRRPPMTPQGATLWSPGSPTSIRPRRQVADHFYFESDDEDEDSDDDDDDDIPITPQEHLVRREQIVSPQYATQGTEADDTGMPRC